MGDIRIVFDPATGTGDFAMAGGGLETGMELETAVLISLFTDGLADPGDAVFETDPRGWWADTYAAQEGPTLPLNGPDRIGSKLWQVFNMPRNPNTLAWMADQILISLGWMKRDGLAQDITAMPRFTSSGGVGATIRIIRAAGPVVYDYAWAQEV